MFRKFIMRLVLSAEEWTQYRYLKKGKRQCIR